MNKSLNCTSDIKITSMIFKSSMQISVRWIITCGAWCWDASRNTCGCQNRPTLPSWRLPCYRYGMICHRSSLIRQSCDFERDFDRVLLQLVDILNIQLKLTGQLTFIIEMFELLMKKLCKFTEYLGRDCMFTWFTCRICGMWPECSSVNTVNLWQNLRQFQIENFFLGNYFFIDTPCQ